MQKRRTLACPKCDRRFAMAAHLGRHMATMHNSRPAASKSTAARPAHAGGGVLGTLYSALSELTGRRSAIDSQVEALERALSLFNGAGAAPRLPAMQARPAQVRRGRRARSGTATLSILKTLADKAPLKPAAVAQLSGVKPHTVSNTLDNLQKIKLVRRTEAGWVLTAPGKAELARRQAT